MWSKVFLLSFCLVLGSCAPRPEEVVEEVMEKKIISPDTPVGPKVPDQDAGHPAPTVPADFEFGGPEKLDVNSLDGYLNIIKMFKGILPEDLTKTIEGLGLSEKNEIVALLSDWYHGKIKRPETKEELVQFLKNSLPSVYEKIDNLNQTFYGKFNKLKPETQEVLRGWKNKALDLKGETPAESAKKQIQLFKAFATSVQTMKDDIKEDLRTQFPTAVNVLDSFGFAIVTSFALILQKIMETFQPTMAPANVECAIPLD